MPSCAVLGCKSNSREKCADIKFYRFPKDSKLSEKWIIACKRKKQIDVKQARICSLHFEESCKKVDVKSSLGFGNKYERNLKDDAVPTLNISHSSESNDRKDSNKSLERFPGGDETKDLCSQRSINVDNNSDQENGENPQTTTNTIHFDDVKQLLKRVEELKAENLRFKNENTSIRIDSRILQEQKRELYEELKSIDKQNKEKLDRTVRDLLSPLFSPGQISFILTKTKRPKWSTGDIAAAFSLHSVSPKAYRYLRIELNYPLPDLSTLRRRSFH